MPAESWRLLNDPRALTHIRRSIGRVMTVRYPWMNQDEIITMQVDGVCAGTPATVPPVSYWAQINQAGARIAVGGASDEPAAFAYGLITGTRGNRKPGAVLLGSAAAPGTEYLVIEDETL